MQFEDVYKLYYRDVYYYLLSMTGDAQTAEDLTQETFYRALKYIDRFKGECHFKTWLCRIGKNVYISWKKNVPLYRIFWCCMKIMYFRKEADKWLRSIYEAVRNV